MGMIDEEGDDIGVPWRALVSGGGNADDAGGAEASFCDSLTPGLEGELIFGCGCPTHVGGLNVGVLAAYRGAKVRGGADGTFASEGRVAEGIRPVVDARLGDDEGLDFALTGRGMDSAS